MPYSHKVSNMWKPFGQTHPNQTLCRASQSPHRVLPGQSKSIWRQSGEANLAIWRPTQSGAIWQSGKKPNLVNLANTLERYELGVRGNLAPCSIWHLAYTNICVHDSPKENSNLAGNPIWQSGYLFNLANLARNPIWQSGYLLNLANPARNPIWPNWPLIQPC